MMWLRKKNKIVCKHIRPLLADLHDGELPVSQVQTVHLHLATCKSCQAELDALHHLSSALLAYPEIDVSPDFDAKLFARLNKRTRFEILADRLDEIFAAPARRFAAAILLSLAMSFATFALLGGLHALRNVDIWEHLLPVQQENRIIIGRDAVQDFDELAFLPEEEKR